MWKIVGASKISVLYIYIYVDDNLNPHPLVSISTALNG